MGAQVNRKRCPVGSRRSKRTGRCTRSGLGGLLGVRVNLHPHKHITTTKYEGDTTFRSRHRWAKVAKTHAGVWYVAEGWKGSVKAERVSYYGKRSPGGRQAAMIVARGWVEDE